MYKTILHATDLAENHYDICVKAAQFAKEHKAELYFIHVIELPTSVQLAQSLGFAELNNPSKQTAKTILKELSEELKIPGDHLSVAIGSVPYNVLEKAKEIKADLIIIGNHYPSGFMGYIGSNANALIHQTPCDILTFSSTQG